MPLAVAFWLYYGPADWRPDGGTNKGEMIDPARPLPAVSLPTADGSPSGAGFLRDKWTMLYVGDGACGPELCRKSLYLTRQSRIALNKDMDRVQRVFRRSPLLRYEVLRRLILPPPVAARLDGEAGAKLLQEFPAFADAPGATGRIYLVDPLGNLMMSYPRGGPDKALLADIKKLLRLSHIG